MKDKDMNDAWNGIINEHLKDYEFASAHSLSEDNLSKHRYEMVPPVDIVKDLDRSVIGQKRAKQLVATAVWNRMLSFRNKVEGRTGDEHYFERNNILLVGNTGCGKTHLVRALADIASMPLVIQDATAFTSAGYVGRDVDACIQALVDEAGNQVDRECNTSSMLINGRAELVREKAEHGIIYIDECDKIRAAAPNNSSGKDVNGRAVQEAFLKMVEGTSVPLKGTPGINEIDTSNILFIFGGAFAGLDAIVSARINKKPQMGFSTGKVEDEQAKSKNPLHDANMTDFTKFGIIPELMGRLPTIAVLDPIDLSIMEQIFSEPDRSVMAQVINEFASYGVRVSFTKSAISYIAEEALKLNIGARGLKATCQQLLRPLFFYLPSCTFSKSLIITKEVIQALQAEELQ